MEKSVGYIIFGELFLFSTIDILTINYFDIDDNFSVIYYTI